MINKFKKPLLAVIVVIEVLVVYYYVYGNHKISDDNLTQWLPIIKQALEYIKHGNFMIYDIYQFGGYSVAGYGYYGVQNFLLLFFGLCLNMLNLNISYVFIMYEIFAYILAAYALYCLLLPKKLFAIFIYLDLILIFMINQTFLGTHNWYYISNSIIEVSLLILALLHLINTFNSKANYFYLGLVVATSAYLGNIQYFFYFLVLILIITFYLLSFFYMHQRKKFKQLLLYMFSNFIIIFFTLAPLLWIVFSIKSTATPFSFGNANSSTIDSIFFYTEWLFPIYNLAKLVDLVDLLPYYHSHIFQVASWSFFFTIIAFFNYSKYFSKTCPVRFKILIPPFMIALTVFIILLTFPISESIFGFNQFRFSYKYLFFIYPLLLVTLSFLAYCVLKKPYRNFPIYVLILMNILIFTLIPRSYFKDIHSIEQYSSVGYNIIKKYKLDVDNYRTLINYELLSEHWFRNIDNFEKYLTANAATKYKIHTIIGYEPSISTDIVKALNPSEVYAKYGPQYILPYGSQYMLSENNIDTIERYSIKYIISNTKAMTELLNKKGYKYELIEANDNMYLYVIKNIKPILSTYSNITKIAFDGEYLNIQKLPIGQSYISYHCSESSIYLQWYSHNKDVELSCINSLLVLNNNSKSSINVALGFHWIYKIYFLVSLVAFLLLFLLVLLENTMYFKYIFKLKNTLIIGEK